MPSIETFPEAVLKGLRPEDFDALWVEVGTASGGSENQVELPRFAHRFFGATFTDYDHQQRQILEPTITAGPIVWVKKLAWHGDNMMERLNMPTAKQGGPTYMDRVVLLERHPGGFELLVADVGSAEAHSWHDASLAQGTLFLMGDPERTDRLCGLLG